MDKIMIRKAIEQHARSDDFRGVSGSKTRQFWYTLKAVICITLNRFRDTEFSDDFVGVAFLNDGNYPSMDFGTIYWWEELIVGYGFFSNWWVSILSDTSA